MVVPKFMVIGGCGGAGGCGVGGCDGGGRI